MAVKKKTEKQTSSWIGEVEKYSRQIWLAGLGAYSKVRKDCTKLFDALVKDGEKAEKLAKSEVDAVKSSVGSKVGSAKSKVDEVKGKAFGKWNELEEAFDKRLNNAISRLGVPSRNEVKALNDKVDSLTRQLEKITGVSAKSVAKPAAKAAPKPAAKAAAKPAAKTAVTPAAKAAAKPAAKAAAKPATKAKRATTCAPRKRKSPVKTHATGSSTPTVSACKATACTIAPPGRKRSAKPPLRKCCGC